MFAKINYLKYLEDNLNGKRKKVRLLFRWKKSRRKISRGHRLDSQALQAGAADRSGEKGVGIIEKTVHPV